MQLITQSLHGRAEINILRFAKIGKLEFLANWGKVFPFRIRLKLTNGKGMGLEENIVAFGVGGECLKICVVDAFVYESTVKAASSTLLTRF